MAELEVSIVFDKKKSSNVDNPSCQCLPGIDRSEMDGGRIETKQGKA